MAKRAACFLLAFVFVPAIALATPQSAPPAQPLPQVQLTPPPFTPDRARAIDGIALGEIHSGSTPGLAIGVVEDGLLVYAHGFGAANVEAHRGMSISTQFYAGSLTRQFTAAAMLLLAQRKQLALTDKVTKYVPELTIAKNATIQDLLYDTSGLPDELQAPGINHDLTRPVKIDDLLRAVNRMTPVFDPGTKSQYNNFNYTVAALIVQRVSQLPLSVFFSTNIFQPLIMTSSFLAGDQGVSPAHAVGYTRTGGRFVRAKIWNPSWLLGNGDLVTTVDDLAKWDIGMPLLLNVDSVRMMWSVAPNVQGTQYGMGWIIDQRGGQRFMWHAGQIAGFHAMNAMLPDQHVAVIVFANADSLSGESTVQPELIANRILDVVAPLPPAHFENVIMTRAAEWLGRLARIDIDRTQLTPAFSQYLTDQLVEQTNLRAMGPVLSLVPIESFERSGDTVYVFDVRFRRGALRYQFALSPDGKIDGLQFAGD
ncbi:MAG TPA: serine hydrolase domain-containing protein [Candidatus Baltobacteraceae bacterium]|jgi:CubicO group peptidase (beta-lactamase class C family)|nr:serine hydrolase domain-containing protein [Candidatus Baltobacteraceae bacterium]